MAPSKLPTEDLRIDVANSVSGEFHVRVASLPSGLHSQSSATSAGRLTPGFWRTSVMRVIAVFLMLVATGCANEAGPKPGGVLTVATVRDMVLIGYSRMLGTSGSFEMRSVYGAPLSCEGRFRYPRPPDGKAYFECSDGQRGSIRIKADGVLSGEGKGTSEMGSVHVVYGYSIDRMNEKLDLPSGTQLVQDEHGIGLVGVSGK